MTTTRSDQPTSKRAGPDADEARAGLELATAVARLCVERRCGNVRLLDLRGKSDITDFFVLATGTSPRQMKTVAEEIEVMTKQEGDKPMSISGAGGDSWIVADFVDFVVHLFSSDARMYYDLDGLWGDAPEVPFAAADEGE